MTAPPAASRAVLHFAESFFQRSETFLYNQISGLQVWRSSLACVTRLNESHFPLPNVETHACSVTDTPWLRLYDRLARRLGRAGTAQRRLTRGMRAGLREAIRQGRPAVVHAHFGINGVIAEPVCREADVPLVTSFYGYDSASPGTELSRSWFYAEYPQLFRTARAILAEGPAIARRLQADWHCPPEKLRVLRIAIPVESIRFRARRPPQGRPAQFLFCGRFVEKKGLLVLLSALARLKAARQRFHLRVIGDGPQQQEANAMIAQEGLGDFVTLLGAQPRDRFWEELDKCDLFVAPSQTARNGDTEGGAPTVLLEAQAAGVPIVTTDHADIPFIVVPHKSALLAKERSADSLAEKLSEAMANSQSWSEMGASGRAFVAANHDIPVVCDRLEGIFDAVSQEHRRPLNSSDLSSSSKHHSA